jgi:hypothetical protein
MSLLFVDVIVVPAVNEEPRPIERRKRNRPARRKPDGRRKALSKGITAKERRDLLRADGFASWLRRPLTMTLDFHPRHLDQYPAEDLDTFFQRFRRLVSTWCSRRKIGSYWVWTRENYEGARREHLHMVMHLPLRLRGELESYIRRLFPGGSELVQIGKRTSERDPETGRLRDGLLYRMKQLRGDAVGKPGPYRLPRETKNRHDDAPVAPVYGKRCGVSDSLALKAEEKWQAEHP